MPAHRKKRDERGSALQLTHILMTEPPATANGNLTKKSSDFAGGFFVG
jgi:hypothetical protein